eukprot:1217067-Amphidinium_carterae.1
MSGLVPLRHSNPDKVQIEMSDETVEEVLQQCELKLLKLMMQTHHLDDLEVRSASAQRHEPEFVTSVDLLSVFA